MLSSRPVQRLSMQMTRCSCINNCSHRCEPIIPAPPATRTFMESPPDTQRGCERQWTTSGDALTRVLRPFDPSWIVSATEGLHGRRTSAGRCDSCRMQPGLSYRNSVPIATIPAISGQYLTVQCAPRHDIVSSNERCGRRMTQRQIIRTRWSSGWFMSPGDRPGRPGMATSSPASPCSNNPRLRKPPAMTLVSTTSKAAPVLALARPTIRGKFLAAGGSKLYVRGVTYGAFEPDAAGREYTDLATV